MTRPDFRAVRRARSNRRKLIAAAALGALTLSNAVRAAPCKLSELRWLKGVWRDDSATTQSQERWTIAPGDRLMGASWLLHADRPGGVIESSTIQSDGATVVMRLRHFSSTLDKAREEKDSPMVFVAAQCDADLVVFDGQGPQTGEHMTYRRDGDHLFFTGDFISQGKPVRAQITFKRQGE
jgi:hypothetical protein